MSKIPKSYIIVLVVVQNNKEYLDDIVHLTLWWKEKL